MVLSGFRFLLRISGLCVALGGQRLYYRSSAVPLSTVPHSTRNDTAKAVPAQKLLSSRRFLKREERRDGDRKALVSDGTAGHAISKDYVEQGRQKNGTSLLQLDTVQGKHSRHHSHHSSPLLWGLPKVVWVVVADVMAMLIFLGCIPIILGCAKKKKPSLH
eukprot:gnl/MRDRNA2_/MRDRNA2_87547_c0_seq1.p1 gnl/MRDRNA2_/MRDRNA2_87547_c0~~gnl/MRDRNA2_/MRDRNA2_87547_c0_seq1.p1  ORF type:complete len:161 (+),score=19.16 gnl/MRDRNA2_/MRDRNA2_87547_c0_seq1:134-616(+)